MSDKRPTLKGTSKALSYVRFLSKLTGETQPRVIEVALEQMYNKAREELLKQDHEGLRTNVVIQK